VNVMEKARWNLTVTEFHTDLSIGEHWTFERSAGLCNELPDN
jgi:hypothetical protein